jgi:hypothetical protein
MMDLDDRHAATKTIAREVESSVIETLESNGVDGDGISSFLLSTIGYMALDIPGVAEYLEEIKLIKGQCPVDYERTES